MKMNWIKLDSPEMLQEMKAASENEKVLVLKFSPKCAINYVVRNLLEREWAEGEMSMKTYIVDVISGKGISAQIEKDYGVDHESPQAIVIDKGKVVFHASHGKVIYSELRKFAN
ncbi:MAG: bacillithiol system redox-active protein YtxJ [Ignavibacteria bacterium]|nr:bacillithiol system redox-active protein YtxJ [Ignavibacteria bacterium]